MYNVHFNSSKKFEFVKFVKLHEIMIFFQRRTGLTERELHENIFLICSKILIENNQQLN